MSAVRMDDWMKSFLTYPWLYPGYSNDQESFYLSERSIMITVSWKVFYIDFVHLRTFFWKISEAIKGQRPSCLYIMIYCQFLVFVCLSLFYYSCIDVEDVIVFLVNLVYVLMLSIYQLSQLMSYFVSVSIIMLLNFVFVFLCLCFVSNQCHWFIVLDFQNAIITWL